MKAEYKIFDVGRAPFTKGVTLVEASAGTGKTYAIGMLVLRAVVELGIPIEKILIVTYTKAATEELKSRIRARLVEAKELLENGSKDPAASVDKTLAAWVSGVREPGTALSRLRLALYDIDLASIFTIHGFCQRMLMEQSLESGQLFDVELLTDIDHVRHQVADDFWRRVIYPLPRPACSLLISRFPTPEELLASVSLVFGHQWEIAPQVGSIGEAVARLDAARTLVDSWWRSHGATLQEKFLEGLHAGFFKKGFAENFDQWFGSITDFLEGKTDVVPGSLQLLELPLLLEELNGNRLRGLDKKQAFLAGYPLSEGEVAAFLTAGEDLLLTLRVHLADDIGGEVTRRLERKGQMGFDDLIQRLADGLRGDRGRNLKKILGDRFRVALIDEFQDTDSAQWYIFSSLFGTVDHYLYLIGDPKQAIYKFRGADIHSYFLARESAVNQLTLDKNYRSHPSLVQEVNRLFGSRGRPFYYEQDRLVYHPVSAAKTVEDSRLYKAGQDLAGMVYCILQPPDETSNGRWSSGKAGGAIRNFVVAEIGRLLGQQEPVCLGSEDGRQLRPGDIGILVRSNTQAREYQDALGASSIPSVIGSRQSVFLTPQCRDLMLVLQAIANPGDPVRLKTAMTTPWFGFDGPSLQSLWQDELQVGRYQGRFSDYNQLWQERGFLVMMSRLLVEEKVQLNLAAGPEAERAIANIYHLLGLIQQREDDEHLGIGQLLQWLKKTMQEEKGGEDAELLLESDEDAVRIVTMHSAKGLEYPVVFCPYLWYASNRVGREKHQIRCHEEQHGQVVDLGSDQFERRRLLAADEDRAEDLRLLYVAVTRAKNRCYTMWADVKPAGNVADAFESALGYLLFPDGFCPFPEQVEQLEGIAASSSVQLMQVIPGDTHQEYSRKMAGKEYRPLLPSERSLYTDWQMSSFSAMVQLSEYGLEADHEVLEGKRGATIPVPGLPAGPNFGNVIHDLLEKVAFQDVCRQKDSEGQLALITGQCDRYGVAAEAGEVQKLLEFTVTTSLRPAGTKDGENFSLAMVPDSQCLKEISFYYRLSHLATERINHILAGEKTVVPLGHKVMKGYLTGFIDLVCRHQDRYYIIDYKTNFLGDNMENYDRSGLTDAMRSHNYGLQYWIYTLVLHRHLKNVLPDYDYKRHFGGVMYLFVRGMTPEIPGSGVYFTRPDYKRLVELDQVTGRGGHG